MMIQWNIPCPSMKAKTSFNPVAIRIVDLDFLGGKNKLKSKQPFFECPVAQQAPVGRREWIASPWQTILFDPEMSSFSLDVWLFPAISQVKCLQSSKLNNHFLIRGCLRLYIYMYIFRVGGATTHHEKNFQTA